MFYFTWKEATLRTLTQVGGSRVVVVTWMEATLRMLTQVGGSRVVLLYLEGGDTQNADTGRWIKSCFSSPGWKRHSER